MGAKLQYTIEARDLELILALLRGGSLASASKRMSIDSSTVFRGLQKIEQGLGQRLFERSRKGYIPTDLAQELAKSAEKVETIMDQVRSNVLTSSQELSGQVRVSTTGTLLHGLVIPSLSNLTRKYPLLQLDLNVKNDRVNLTKREADIALRVTQTPPKHLVGKFIGAIRFGVYAHKKYLENVDVKSDDMQNLSWIAPDYAIPEHPTVIWRQHKFPRVEPTLMVDSIFAVWQSIECGSGIGAIPTFVAKTNPDLVQLMAAPEDVVMQIWLLTHPEVRYLRRIATVYDYLSETLVRELTKERTALISDPA